MEDSLNSIEAFKSCKFLFVDTETNGKDIRDGRGFATGISIAGRVAGKVVSKYYPFRHGTGGNLPEDTLNALRSLFSLPIPIAAHNLKFDLVSAGTFGTVFGGPRYCTIKLAHLLNENLFVYDLNGVARFYLGQADENQKDVSEEFKKAIELWGWENIPWQIMEPYACRDAELGYRIAEKIWPLLKQENLLDYWHEHKQDFFDVIIAMESRGVLIDQELCQQQITIGEERMAEIVKELGGFYAHKSADLKVLLIDKLGLPVVKVSEKTGKPSFDKYAMEEYDEMLERVDSDVAKLIMEYRGWFKAVTSNYRPYLELLSPDGALRPNYKLHGTKTGRMSCSSPNLQQIPRVSDKAWNGHMKKAFIARPGYSLWEADYSQLELRLGTAYAKEQGLLQVFLEGRDIFTEMSIDLGMTRQDTKTFVYLTQYGGGVRRAQHALGISQTKARIIRENYFRTYPGFKRVADMAQAKTKAHGKIKLWSGRWRHFRDPDKDAHKAFNSLIQGGAADIVEKIMVKLFYEIDQPSNDECRMLLQVHDSVVFEIKNGKEDYYKERILSLMENVDAITGEESFGVKFAVEVKKWGGD